MKLTDEQYIAAIEGWPIMAQWGRKSVEALAEVLAQRQPAQSEAHDSFTCRDVGCGECASESALEGIRTHKPPSAQPEAQPTYEDVDMADANAAEQFAVCYVAKVGVSKETMIDAISTLQAIILTLRGRLVAQPEAQPAPDVVEQQVTAILQETVRETNERWVAAAEKIARVREGK